MGDDGSRSADPTNPLYAPVLGDHDEQRMQRLAARARGQKSANWVKDPTAKPGLSRLAQWVAANKSERVDLEKRWRSQDARKTRTAEQEAKDEQELRDRVAAARSDMAGK